MDNSELEAFETRCSYYDTDEINSLLDGDNELVIVHHNVRSFNKNFDNLSLLLSQITNNIDIIILSETWFNDSISSDIDGYSGYHTFRSDRNGGGISVYVRVGLGSCFLSEYSVITDDYEICAVDVIPDINNIQNNFIVLGIYRPPNSNIPVFSNHIENLALQLRDKAVMLCGDINIDLILDNINSDFFNILYEKNFFPLINIPTRVTYQSATCIDHIWFNRLKCKFSGAIVSDISDHFPIFCILGVTRGRDLIKKTFRLHSVHNVDKLCIDVENMCNDYFIRCSLYNVEDKCNWFLSRFKKIYNHDCPKKTKSISIKSLQKPWISNDIKRMANYKHKLFKQYKMQIIDFYVYNRYKNNLNRIIKNSKRKYFIDKFNSCLNNSKKTWKIISSILSGPSKKSNNNISLLDDRGQVIDNQTDVSNIFCDHFSTIASKLDSDIPICNTDPLDYMPDPLNTSFSPQPATCREVEDVILALKDKPCHVDSIPVFIFKKLAHLISPIICDIFNSSVVEGHFPSCLKIARITPLHKSKSKQVKTNFRPISLLPLVSKILEKLLKKRACKFIEENNILFNKQFGFRPGCSTTDAVLLLVDDCVRALDERLYTITIFLDFSKAFDTVNKDILLCKLDRLGFRGNVNNMLKSYLSDRKMYVSLNGCNSDIKTVNIGVPQGSVSSAWLFSLYINDMHRSSKKLKFIHFADDTTVYMSGGNLSRLCRDVCDELKLVDRWMNANRLSLNIEKTYFMIHTHNSFNIDECTIKIRDQSIKYVTSTKFLGMTIDNQFNFNYHLCNLTKQLSKVKGLLFKLSSYIPPDVLRKIYYALFYSRISYGIQVWGGSNKTNVDKLIRLNNSSVNIFLNGLPPNIVSPLHYNSIYMLNSLLSFFKYTHNCKFAYFYEKINELMPHHFHETRFVQCNNLTVPYCHKSVSQKQFFYNSVKFWNSLPPNMKDFDNIFIFKTNIRKYVQSIYSI